MSLVDHHITSGLSDYVNWCVCVRGGGIHPLVSRTLECRFGERLLVSLIDNSLIRLKKFKTLLNLGLESEIS